MSARSVLSMWKAGLLVAALAFAFTFACALPDASAATKSKRGTDTSWSNKAEQSFFLSNGMANKLMTREEWQTYWQKMKNMSADERMSYRGQMHKKFMQEARDRGMDVPGVPPGHGDKGMTQRHGATDATGKTLLLLAAGGGAGAGGGASAGGGFSAGGSASGSAGAAGSGSGNMGTQGLGHSRNGDFGNRGANKSFGSEGKAGKFGEEGTGRFDSDQGFNNGSRSFNRNDSDRDRSMFDSSRDKDRGSFDYDSNVDRDFDRGFLYDRNYRTDRDLSLNKKDFDPGKVDFGSDMNLDSGNTKDSDVGGAQKGLDSGTIHNRYPGVIGTTDALVVILAGYDKGSKDSSDRDYERDQDHGREGDNFNNERGFSSDGFENYPEMQVPGPGPNAHGTGVFRL